MELDLKATLLRAADLLESGKLDWTQGSYWRVDRPSGTVCAVCALGACAIVAARDSADYIDRYNALLIVEEALSGAGLDESAIINFNDGFVQVNGVEEKEERTKDEVIAYLRILAERV